jgi:hypothetical protein
MGRLGLQDIALYIEAVVVGSVSLLASVTRVEAVSVG